MKAYHPLSEAEARLAADCADGRRSAISDGAPVEESPGVSVRTGLPHMLRRENRWNLKNPLTKLVHWLHDSVIRAAQGHGYRPARILVFAVMLFLGLAAFFS